jgi:hypothetical protein
MLARFCVLSRLKEHENSNLFPRCASMTARSLKDTDPRPSGAGIQGRRRRRRRHDGVSTRFAFKVLSETFNFDTEEVAADPVHLMYVLEQAIRREQFPTRSRSAISSSSRPSWRRAMPNSSATRSRRPISNPIRLRPEPVRPLRRLCRRLDRGPGLQGSRHRPAAGPRAAEPGAVQDREAGGHRQSEGLPQRGREVRAALARQQRRQESRPGPPMRRSAR